MVDLPALMTADELLQYDAPGTRTELLRGQLLVREPTGGPHAVLLTTLTVAVELHVRNTTPRAGLVFVGDPGFWIARRPDTVRAPDLAFVSRDRLDPDGEVAEGYLTVVPDLAVEVRSPTDRSGELLQKVGQWLSAGVSLVWVIDPARRVAQTHSADGTITLLSERESLNADPVLPGLTIPLASLLRPR
jgi:Uma2 family endonuclease